MDWTTLIGPLFTGALDAAESLIPLAVPVMVFFAGLGIVIKVASRAGVKTR